MKFPFTNPLSSRFLPVVLLVLLWIGSAHGAEIVKASNQNDLNLTSSWVGGVVPTASDVAVWNSTQTGAGIENYAIGGNLSFQGIKMTDPVGTLHNITPTTGFALTLGSSGIDMSAATADLRISANFVTNATQTWSIASGRTLEVLGTNTGSGTISVTGPGTVVFGTDAFGTGDLRFDGGLTLATASNRSVANDVFLDGDINIDNTNASADRYISLNGDIDIGSGVRTVTISNPNATSPTASTLRFSGPGASGVRQLTGSGTLVLENGNASQSPTAYVGFGTSDSNFTEVHSDVSIGSGVEVSFGAEDSFTADTDLTVQLGGVINLSTGGSVSKSQTVGSLSGAGTVLNGATNTSTGTLTIDGGSGTGSTNFSGAVQNGSTGVIAVTKTGSTTQIFSGSNTYTGQTQVTGGTLLINGTHIESVAVTQNGYESSTSGHFLVANGATLGGSGRIAGNNSTNNANMILVQDGGTLAPGSSIGTLTLDGANISGTGARVLNMATGAEFAFELSGSGGTPDRIDFWNYAGGDLVLNSNVLDLTLSGSVTPGTYVVSLFRFFSDNGVTGANSGLTSGLILGDLGPGFDGTPTLNFNAGGNTIDLTYTVVPEPSAQALVGLLLVFLAVLAQRRRLSKS